MESGSSISRMRLPSMPMAGVPWDTVLVAATHELIAAVGEVLLDDAERVAKDCGIKTINRDWAHGDPASCILDVARKEKADLIVMGSRGLSDLRGLLVGSVSHKVNQLSACACLTVK